MSQPRVEYMTDRAMAQFLMECHTGRITRGTNGWDFRRGSNDGYVRHRCEPKRRNAEARGFIVLDEQRMRWLPTKEGYDMLEAELNIQLLREEPHAQVA